MMNDRELLELAAKAASKSKVIEKCGIWYADGYPFNPLTDDGDALRLAVKLDIQISKSNCGTEAIAFRPVGLQVNEPIGDDPYAATRRAIVHAAAEIGKGM